MNPLLILLTASILSQPYLPLELGWERVSKKGSAPGHCHAIAYDTSRQKVILWAAEPEPTGLWEWDGSAWTLIDSSGPQGFGDGIEMVYDESREKLVWIGNAVKAANLETWEWDEKSWTKLPLKGPSTRSSFALAYDAARMRTVLFGGWRDVGNVFDDTWEYDGTKWMRVGQNSTGLLKPLFLDTSCIAPEPRDSHAMAYDRNRKKTVLFGGIQVCETHTKHFNGTWEWDGMRWTKASAGMNGRWGHTMAYDPILGKVIMFGGVGIQWNPTWAWDGEKWEVISRSGPERRGRHSMAYDIARKRMVLFGGLCGPQEYHDTWEYPSEYRVKIIEEAKRKKSVTT
ncbi:MAG: hypothetical protein ABIH23_33385 [bacterium]